jgi:16S rRNA (guanine(966)-N(2))-methyltransferase RsmD
VRIVGGTYKGRKIAVSKGFDSRPTTDFAREALFNIFGADIVEARFLDLFGGTGGVGIEALSRGAAHAVFIEKNRKAQDTIKANLLHTNLSDRAEIVRGDAFRYLQDAPQPFHYIYIAPPQYAGLWLDALKLIDEQPGWLADDGEIIVQIHPKEYADVALEHFKEIEQRKYSSTLLVFYEHKPAD